MILVSLQVLNNQSMKIIEFRKIQMMMNNNIKYLHKELLKMAHLIAFSLRILIWKKKMREKLVLSLLRFQKMMRLISLIPKNIKFIQLFPNS